MREFIFQQQAMRTFVYCLKVSMISGARYQRVATYSYATDRCTSKGGSSREPGQESRTVMKPVSVPLGSAVLTLRARPKSQT